jgi:pimeloyl-ACP methyl ester carboxylesterase
MNSLPIYLISGLGADERVFSRLDFIGHEVFHIKWITPQMHDTLETYAAKLVEQVTHSNCILVGVSLGGMLAVEMAIYLPNSNIIIISSAKSRNELPWYFKIPYIYHFVPISLMRHGHLLADYFFGVSNAKEKLLLKDILKNTDTHFTRWAVKAICCWKRREGGRILLQMHGTADRIIPSRNIKNADLVKDGHHLLVLSKSEAVNKALRNLTI